MVWQSRHGELGSVEVRSGLVSHVRLGVVGTVTSVWGGVSHGRRGKEKLVVFRCGPVRRGELSRGMAGTVGLGTECPVGARSGK